MTANLARLDQFLERLSLSPDETEALKGKVSRLAERLSKEPKTLKMEAESCPGRKTQVV